MLSEISDFLQKYKNRVIIFLIALIALDIFVYWQIFVLNSQKNNLLFYFLEVGQGDSSLIILPNNVKILIDGGPPNGKLLEVLAKILPPHQRYLDLVILTHPERDHFSGFLEILRRYQIGLFIHNGRSNDTLEFEELKKIITEKKIKTIDLAAGDKIRYQQNIINIISPTKELLKQKNFSNNDTSLVFILEALGVKALFTGDISAEIENKLVGFFKEKGPIDILKVPHHGSKFSSSFQFLSIIQPRLAVIEVGKNPYGHPTSEVINRLKAVGAIIYRTDEDKTIKILLRKNKEVEIFKL